MEAPTCRLCKHKHWGGADNCVFGAAEAGLKSVREPSKPKEVPSKASELQARIAELEAENAILRAKVDGRTAYQREYMKKRRARQ